MPPVCPFCASGRGLCGCCSMVQACSVCSRVHRGSLAAQAAAEDMDKADKASPSAKKHVRLQERCVCPSPAQGTAHPPDIPSCQAALALRTNLHTVLQGFPSKKAK